jgi:mono/diheme cytochrome c family protein
MMKTTRSTQRIPFVLTTAYILVSLSWSSPVLKAADTKKPIDFNRDIRPILSDNCFSCHGPDEHNRKAKLRLDTKEGLFSPHDGGSIVKPGNLSESEMIQRIISTEKDEVMPPPETNKKLKPEQVELVREWINQGAPFQLHWSFSAPAKPAEPKVENSWAKSPIDKFLILEMAKKNLAPNGLANKETLIRRLTLDLTGLPPTPAEVQAFLSDKSASAYDKLVDRLINSPQYGENMARGWLDVARYADTHGLHLDNERSMWPYRDWVVKAFNENLPFDQFATWQLAGDQLPNATSDQQVASGFNRCNVTTSEGGSIDAELLVRYAVDRADTTAGVFMGLTAGCAVCHDHKFDPISQKDFYSLYSFFYNLADPAMDGNKVDTPPILRLPTDAQKKQIETLDKSITESEKQLRDKLLSVVYADPATLSPALPVVKSDTVLFDDAAPAGSKVTTNEGNPATRIVEGKAASGKAFIERTDAGLAQDIISELKQPVELPRQGDFTVAVRLDPKNPPKAVMVQFNVNGTWAYRAVWGDANSIPYGTLATPERLAAGDLPKPGEWTNLSFDLGKFQIKPDMKITGFAFTQFGGTVAWDNLAIHSEKNPAKDASESFAVWARSQTPKTIPSFPGDIQPILKKNVTDRTLAENRKLEDHFLINVWTGGSKAFGPIRDTMAKARQEKSTVENQVALTFVSRDLDQPRQAHILFRGQYDKPREPVKSTTPAFLPPLKQADPKGRATRLDLAKWLTAADHPLMARVTVNRYWQQFFGIGLVKTSGDFGSQGEPPVNQALLDWLSVDFRESGWNVKRLVRLMVTSAAYMQDSKADPKKLEIDPENRLLSHGPRFRLDAEVLRDQALSLSGLLNSQIGGKGVKTYQPINIWEPVGFVGSNTRDYKQDEGSALYRRSLYMFWKRTAPHPAMTTFDAPSRESFCVRRERSNTPLQALVLMNDVQHYEAARNLAQRLILEGGKTPDDRLAWGFRLVTAREPNASELTLLKSLLTDELARYKKDPEAAKKAIANGQSKPNPALDSAELAAYTLVGNLLLNLDETVMKN